MNERLVSYLPAQKAVAALVAIGQPKAAELLKYLSRADIAKLMATSKTMSAVTQDGLENIVNEFEMEYTRGTGLLDSSVQILSILSESFDDAELALIIGGNGPATLRAPVEKTAWEVLAECEPLQIAEFLTSENPQVGAFVLSRLPSSRAAEILAVCEREMRAAILTRMMSLGDVSEVTQTFIEDELLLQFGSVKTGANKEALARVATILNELDRDATEAALDDISLRVEDGDMVVVRSMMFRFEDIVGLTQEARSAAFDSVPVDILTMALRDATADVSEAALAAISQRSRRMIENDLKNKAQVRPADIANARKRIVSDILRLAGSGKIELPQPVQEAA